MYVAPNTGGESFGIILAEAMASQTAVVASDLQAFSDLLGGTGALFASEDSADLARVIIELFDDENLRSQLALSGYERSQTFAWESVAQEVLAVYEMALVGNSGISLESESRVWNRLRNTGGGE